MAHVNRKRRRRALSDLERGLARGDADLAADGLCALAADERAEHVPAVADIALASIERARARGEWSSLVRWAKRVEIEPRLLSVLDRERAADFRWALVWGCGLSGEWRRAEASWAALAREEDARGRAPLLSGAMDRWLATRGAPELAPEVRERLALPAAVARLGIEPIRPRDPSEDAPLPTAPADAEGATIRARAMLGVAGLAAWVDRARSVHRGTASDDVALLARAYEVAAGLAMRDALLRITEGASPAASLALFAKCAAESAASASDALVALRLCMQLLQRGDVVARETLVPIVCAASSDETLRPLVERAITGLAGAVGKEDPRMDVLLAAVGALVSRAAGLGAATWATAAVLAYRRGAALEADAFRGRAHGEARALARFSEQSAWIEARMGEAVADDAELGAWLRAADKRARADLFAFVGAVAPLDAAAGFVLVAARERDPWIRHDLVECVKDLLARSSMRYCAECGVEHPPEIEIERFGDLRGKGRDLWARIEPAVVPLSHTFLAIASSRSVDAGTRRQIFERYLTDAPTPMAWLEAIALVGDGRPTTLERTLIDRMVARFAHDAEALAAGWVWVEENAARPEAFAKLAEALVFGAAASGTPLSASARAAAAKARRLIDGVERRCRRRRRPHRAQGELFGGDDVRT